MGTSAAALRFRSVPATNVLFFIPSTLICVANHRNDSNEDTDAFRGCASCNSLLWMQILCLCVCSLRAIDFRQGFEGTVVKPFLSFHKPFAKESARKGAIETLSNSPAPYVFL